MRASIIINNYNYAPYLGQAIDSALAQTYKDFEVVVVDDGSTDESIVVIRSYGEKVIPILKSNGGQASAMNAGFAASSGDIILFLDADDILAPNAIKEVVNHWETQTAHLYYRLQIFGINREDMGHFPKANDPIDEGPDAWRKIAERGSVHFPPTSGNVFSRGALTAIGPIPEEQFRIRADVYLLHKASFYGNVKYLSGILGFYRVHGGNSWFQPAKRTRAGLHLSRRSKERIIKSLIQRGQKFELIEEELRKHGASWGEDARYEINRLRLRRLISKKLFTKTHPFAEDDAWDLLKRLLSDCRFPFCRRFRDLSLSVKSILSFFSPKSILKFLTVSPKKSQ